MTPEDVLRASSSHRDNGTVTRTEVDHSRADLDPTHRFWKERAGGEEQRLLDERLLHARGSVMRFLRAGLDQQPGSRAAPLS